MLRSPRRILPVNDSNPTSTTSPILDTTWEDKVAWDEIAMAEYDLSWLSDKWLDNRSNRLLSPGFVKAHPYLSEKAFGG